MNMLYSHIVLRVTFNWININSLGASIVIKSQNIGPNIGCL